jgi:hypothetical protein
MPPQTSPTTESKRVTPILLKPGRIKATTNGVAQEAQDAARLIAASYEYQATGNLQRSIEKHITPEIAAKYGAVDPELSSRNVLVFVNDEGVSTLAYRGTVTRREWGFDARDIALGAREESSAFFQRTYYETARRVAEKYGAKPALVVGHSLGGNAAIRTIDKGLVDRSISLNPFVRPRSIGAGEHTIYRHADNPALTTPRFLASRTSHATSERQH